MKRQLKGYIIAKALLSSAFVVAAYLFFALAYRGHLHYHEQYQLFLFTGDYACQVLSQPGGASDLVSGFLIQFFINPYLGGLLMALMLSALQLLTWRSMRGASKTCYPLSFIPALLMWMYLCNENALPSSCISLIISTGCACLTSKIANQTLRGIVTVLLTPLLYMLVGPLAVVFVFISGTSYVYMGGALILWILCPIAAQYIFPFPLNRLYIGLHYHRFPQAVPYLAWASALAVAVLSYIKKVKNIPYI